MGRSKRDGGIPLFVDYQGKRVVSGILGPDKVFRKTEKLAQAGNDLDLPISGLWWTPARIALHTGQQWKTVVWPQYQYSPKGQKMQTVAVSPIGTDGLAHFVAWDIDANDPQHVRAILNALPKGAIPLVSLSGKKGFHIWCFPSQPIPAQVAIAFAKAICERANILCECYPSSKRSKCLKWPLSVHPETGKVEVFVNEHDLTTEYDTQALLEALAGGMWRTPSEVIIQYVEANTPRKPKAKKRATTKARPDQRVEAGHWLETFRDEQAGFKLLELFGKHVRASRLGQSFKCPIHNERRPSASFIRDSNGLIAFHEWHWEKYGLESEFFTLPELYVALRTRSELRKLDRREQAASAKEAAFLLGFTNALVEEVSSKWLESTRILLKLGVVTNLIFKRLVTTPTPKDWLKALNLNGLSDFEKVWVTCFWCFIQDAMDGKRETVMSKRFVGERTGVKYWQVNRIMNLVCSLGLLEKCEMVKHGKRLGADRYRLCRVNEAEAKRRFDLLFPEGRFNLRQFKASLVAERLGEETAKAIFRRHSETVKLQKSIEIYRKTAKLQRNSVGTPAENFRRKTGEIPENFRRTLGKPHLFPRGTPGKPRLFPRGAVGVTPK